MQRARKLAVKLLLRQNLYQIKTDLYSLDCRKHILIDSFQNYAKTSHRPLSDFMQPGMDECIVIPIRGRFLILYDNERLCFSRRRWSIAHEIGHICCRHDCDGPLQEAQANVFAAELLAPMVVVQELYRRGHICCPLDVSNLFGISAQAGQHRWDELLYSDFTPLSEEEELLQRYLPLIHAHFSEPCITVPPNRATHTLPILL